mmetsp:Transcript_30123/g.29015  ORF Transcript_30123/g.29015 Transcript_30123/m.29015 type:complete len:102 (-) Transcript_30123:756-1061(-)|eukprot:CAMPEP_0197830582 /NCGR_PEP_ID=MMETSP1437-20131217/7184_1 /TAXON_ID=49252 ORGANISM="Eucampia antarctica, Strain CCMP1452" /NCGR_SAMPLE_ID=MMETSP1437 /ASSEMBLY_ACC=CAM_ASM_001096 /LENGTH=101 /DNA_ID=CAMNT_0043433065 /DNA_START=11 /DNA_END=316 /DNA_ORIENTATION=+
MYAYTITTVPQIINPSYDPTDPEAGIRAIIDKPRSYFTYIKELLLKDEVQIICYHVNKLQDDMQWVHQTLNGECDDGLIVKLETSLEYNGIDTTSDTIKLM